MSLDNSSSPTFWYMIRNVSSNFGCISSTKVKFWVMYGFALSSNVREDNIYELIGGWEGDEFRFCFVLLNFDWIFDVMA